MRLQRFVSLFAIVVMIVLSACGSPGAAPAPAGAPQAAAATATGPRTATNTAASAAVTAAPTDMPAPTPAPRPLPPTVVAVQPGRGQEQPVSAPVVVTFDQPMDPASTAAAFKIEPQAAGDVKVENDRLTWTPSEQLERGKAYKVTLASSAASATGLKLQAPITLAFTTSGFLQVTNVQPEHGAAGVPVDTPIVVAFNRPVVPLTAAGDQATLPQPLVITPTVTGKGEWINTSIYSFTPEGGLAASQTYSVTVAAGLADTTGGVLAEPFTWEFSTIDPVIVRWTPENPNIVAPDKPITVTFSMAMDKPSTEAAWSLTDDAAKAPVAGLFSWNADATELSFKPNQILKFGALYRARVATTAKAANGAGTLREMPVNEFGFRTVELPKVLTTDPKQGSKTADPNQTVRLTFVGPMDPTSFISGTVTILPKPTRVYTWYNEFENQLYIDFAKLPAADYSVTLSGKVADPYGNTLGQDYVLKFRTRNLDPLLTINNQGQVGTYNAYTETQAVVTYRNQGEEVRFDLYDVSTDDFIALTGKDYYQAWDNYRPKPDARVREWSRKADAPANKLGFMREPLVDADGNPLKPGIYWLEVTGVLPQGQRSPRQLIVRTDLNVTMKADQDNVLAWVTDLRSGQPVPGATVRFTDNAKNDLTATTDKDGVAQVKLAASRQLWDGLTAIATTPEGGFAAVTSNWYDGIGPWDFGVNGMASQQPYNGYVYTDRPIYRPGQTVYWKAIIRRDNDALYTLPAPGQPISVTVNDAQGNTVLQQQLTLDALGAADGSLELGPEATLGYYFISLRLNEEVSFGTGFSVAEYRKPEYEVSAKTDKPEYVQGESIQLTSQANYFFGAPVANAKVHWLALTSDAPFAYQGPGNYSFMDWNWWDTTRQGPYGGAVSEGEGVTDSQGRFTVSIPADISKYPTSQRFNIDVTVQDINNQAVSTQASAVVHKAELYVGIQPSSYVVNAGQGSQVDILTVDPQSKPVAGVDVDVVINQVEWRSVREQVEDGRYYWVTRPVETPVISDTVKTAADGTAAVKWTPPAAGEYKANATARDSKGHTMKSAAYIWVSGPEYAAWRQENNDRIKLAADKAEYAVGDVAEVLIPSPYQGKVKALVTIERGQVLDYQVIELASNSEVLNLPVGENWIPTAYVSVVIMKGIDATSPSPSFKMGLISLPVSVATKELKVVVTPRTDETAAASSAATATNTTTATVQTEPLRLAPRSKVTWDVRTYDASGKPVQADVSLALVDKAVLTLAQDMSGPILDRFYSQRPLGVQTATTLALNIDRLVTQLAEEGKGGGGGDGGPGATSVRTEFPDIAYWRASVDTGPGGAATIDMVLPDNLTTWVMDARAATGDTLVGQSRADVIATKDLLIRPVLPRFFVAGDKAEIAGIVHNTTANPLDVTVTMKATGLDVPATTSQTATVKPGETYKATWPITVQGDAAEVKVTMSVDAADAGAATAHLNDAVEVTLPVERYSTPEVIGTSGQVANGEQVLELIRLPLGIDPTRGQLDVTIEPSLAAGMIGGLTYLEHYPYECAEQTVSRFLPNVVSFAALKDLGIANPDLATKLAQQVGVGLQRLYGQQNLDGGWGWWPNDESNPTVSAYVVFGMAKAQAAGFTVDQNVLERGMAFLTHTLAAPAGLKDWQLNQQAFTLLALAEAGQKEPNRAGALFAEKERMDNFGKAYLAMALGLIGDEAAPERIKTLLADLSGSAVVTVASAHWEEGTVDYWNMNTDTRSTAIVLGALARLDPQNILAPNAVRWLMTARNADHWETTQENAWSIMALTDWMAATGELKGDYDWKVELNNAPLGNGTVTPENVQEVVQLHADITQLLVDQTNSLVLARASGAGQTGDGQMYYTAYLRTYQPVDKVEPESRGLSVNRTYQMAECVAEQKTALELKTECPVVMKAKVGDVLQATVTVVVPNTSYYVIVEDPLPAGTEAVDTGLLTTSQAAQGPAMEQQPDKQQGSAGWWWTPTHVELRDEKAVMFATMLEPGTYQFTYQVRASLPGTFYTLPSNAYQMYFPEVWGRGAGSVFTVTQ
jgi:alpha-2-macroglobulin